MSICRLCRKDWVVGLLNLGMQPICNRYLRNAVEEEYKHSLAMGQCNACGVVQLIDPVPARELLPPYDWITYKEPEGHLDQVAEIICGLPGLTKDSRVCGLSYKEDSTLERLKNRGFDYTWRIDLASDLGITDSRAGAETIQDRLNPDVAEFLVEKYGAPDVIIARHILEHAHDTLGFMETLRRLVNREGYVVFEVPDCTRALESLDYTTVWEEHILYFTPETLRRCFALSGFSLVTFECYRYPYENSLVGIVRLDGETTPTLPSLEVLEHEKRRADTFSQGMTQQRRRLSQWACDYRQTNGKVAVFGAGHLACTFINLMGLKDAVEFVVDDDPHKQGLFMPGSRLPIFSSSALIRENIRLCLMGLSPGSEDRVIQKNHAFLERGGLFASIFSSSRYALGSDYLARSATE